MGSHLQKQLLFCSCHGRPVSDFENVSSLAMVELTGLRQALQALAVSISLDRLAIA